MSPFAILPSIRKELIQALGMFADLGKKQDEMSRTVLRLPCFFSMLVGSHNKLVVIGTWHCSPKPGLLGSGPSGKSQTQLEKLPAKPVCSDQFFPMNIFL